MKPGFRYTSAAWQGIATLVAILLSACLGSADAGASLRMPKAESRFSTLAVAVLTIEPRPVDRSSGPALGDGFARFLAEGATTQAERSLVQSRIAASVVKETPGAQRLPRLVGAVRMPVSLPPGLHGLEAARHKGDLAVATVELLDAEGRVLATGTAAVEWNDVRWLRGARYRRSRPVNQVLGEAARKSVDLAIERLVS